MLFVREEVRKLKVPKGRDTQLRKGVVCYGSKWMIKHNIIIKIDIIMIIYPESDCMRCDSKKVQVKFIGKCTHSIT